jgi:VWFA-related protein
MSSLLSVITLLAGSLLLAQEQPPAQQPVFKSSVRTVPIYATVVDSGGRLVPELEQSDFTILDNGKPAEVTLFSNESQPFTAVVMLDTSASMTANLKLLNRAAEQFLLRLLPVDKAQVGAAATRSTWSASAGRPPG